jgi:ribose-phosphate pyrophosphokinase
MLRVINGDTTTDVEYIVFPGGEVHLNHIVQHPIHNIVTIQATIHSSDDLMAVMLLGNCLREQCNHVDLDIDYLPYARQDRICTPGDPFSLRVLSGMLNYIGFRQITVSDPHSPVSKDIVSRLKVRSQLQCLPHDVKRIAIDATLVAPDKGATAKTQIIAEMFGSPSVSQAHKVRDPKTGEITGTEVDREDYYGETCLIIDDICDGGRTFHELAKVLKARNAGVVVLHVTHGIFSKGKEYLSEYIDAIHTTYDWTK